MQRPRTRAALVLRDNLRNRTRIERAYRRAIAGRTRRSSSPMPISRPAASCARHWYHAAQRGVKVRLLLQGRYEYFMQFHAVRPMYGVLLRAGVEIHEYSPSFLHAKVAVIDGHWATVGSSNLDPLSLLLAREANVVVEDVSLAPDRAHPADPGHGAGGPRVEPDRYAQPAAGQRRLDHVALALMRIGVCPRAATLLNS